MLPLMHSTDSLVDGVSITHGNPREHIWTFSAAIDEVLGDSVMFSCPCIRNDSVDRASAKIPSFVRDDNYFCDTASREYRQLNVFYGADPLWDGAGCGPLSTCCSFNNPPWFYKPLSHPTSDDIEMRVCRDQVNRDEDIAIEMYDIYIQ